jgi:hypothetical protein
MDKLWDLNLIHFLDFYFMLMFLASTWRRSRQYSELGQLLLTGPRRWPHLLRLVSEHRTVFLTWPTIAPAFLAFVLSIAQLIASRVIWPEAGYPPNGLTLARLVEHHLELPIVILLAGGVLAVDVYFLIAVGIIDRPLLEKYFDQAEYWLASRAAHMVHIVTFGYFSPRRMVSDEVRKALIEASNLINSALWWTSLQVALRFAFGLSLWIAWAMG